MVYHCLVLCLRVQLSLCYLATDTCDADKWTWQILLIAFFAAALVGVIVVLILLFACFRGKNKGHEYELGIR